MLDSGIVHTKTFIDESHVTMPFVKIDIGGYHTIGEPLTVLCDTGCSHSLLSEQMYLLITQKEHLHISNHLSVELQTARGNPEPVNIIEVELVLTFYSPDGQTLRFMHETRVMPSLSVPMLLGSDLLRSSRVLCIQKDRLLITKDEQKRSFKPNPSLTQPSHVFVISLTPLAAHKEIRLVARIQNEVKSGERIMLTAVPAFLNALGEITETHFAICDPFIHRSNSKNKHTFEVITQPTAEPDGSGGYCVYVKNITDKTITIREGQHVANLELSDITIPQSHKALTSDGLFVTRTRQPMSCMHSFIRTNEDLIHAQQAHFIQMENARMWNDQLNDLYEQMGKTLDKDLRGDIHITTAMHLDTSKPLDLSKFTNQHLRAWMQEDETIEFPSRNKPGSYNKEGYFTPTIQEMMEKGNTNTFLKHEPEASALKPIQDIVAEIDVSHLTPHQQDLVRNLFMTKDKLLSKHSLDIGNTNVLEATINLKDTKSTFHQKYVPIPPEVRPQVDEIIQQYLDYGILRVCSDPTNHVSNIFVIRKKCGSLDRLIFDARLINMNTVRNPSNIATNSEIIHNFASKDWCTLLDLTNAFYSIRLDAASQPLTTFYDGGRNRYCFQRLPMGFLNSPACLDSVMTEILGNTKDCFYYVDDVAVCTSGTFEEHLATLEEVLQKLEKGGLKIKASKIRIAQKEVEFLGFKFAKDKFSVPKARIQAIYEIPVPRNPKECRSFIGMISYYRKLVKKFSDIVYPIQRCANSAKEDFNWNEEAQQAFENIKEVFKEEITGYIPRTNRPFNCYSDASQHCLSFICMQLDDEGIERLVACISRTLNKSEINYSTHKKEVIAMSHGLVSLRFYLAFAMEINMYTDAKAILFLQCAKNASPLLMRQAATLSMFPLNIYHIPGPANPADYFTRDGTTEPLDVTQNRHNFFTEAEAEYFVSRLVSIPQQFIPIKAEETRLMLTLDAPRNPFKKNASKRDTLLGPKFTPSNNKPIMVPDRRINIPRYDNFHPIGKNPSKDTRKASALKRKSSSPIRQNKKKTVRFNTKPQVKCFATETTGNNTSPGITIDNLATLTETVRSGRISLEDFRFAQETDDLCNKLKAEIQAQPNNRFFINKQLLFHRDTQKRQTIVLPRSLLNVTLFMHHFSIWGQHKSRERMYQDITSTYWFPDLRQIIKDYTAKCFFCVYSKKFVEPKQAFGETPQSAQPRQLWYFDIASGFPKASGYRYIYVFVDQFSLYTILIPAKTKSTHEILTAFKTQVIANFNLPLALRSDRECGISASHQFQLFAKQHSIKLLMTASSSPFSNAIAELRVKALKTQLRAILLMTAQSDWPSQLYLVQIAINTTPSHYKFSPQTVLFGLDSHNPKQLLNTDQAEPDHDKYVALISSKLKTIREEMDHIRQQHKARSREYANRSRIYKFFSIGDMVWIRNNVISGNSALQVRHTGPAVIEAIHGNAADVRDIHTNVLTKQHFANLVPVSATSMAMPDNWDELIRNPPIPHSE